METPCGYSHPPEVGGVARGSKTGAKNTQRPKGRQASDRRLRYVIQLLSCQALTLGLVQQHSGSHRDVEALHRSGLWQSDQEITGIAGELAQARAFRAHDQSYRTLQIGLVSQLGRLGIGTD